MEGDLLLTLAILAVALALFVSDRVRLDVVAMGVLVALCLGGVLEIDEALAGFSDPIVIMIAGLFLVGEGLAETGVAKRLGSLLARAGGRSERRLLLGCLLTSASLSAFMSSTGAVAILIPVVLGIARETGVAASRLLMPLSFGSLLGGMLTLIGTPPNLVVNRVLAEAGQEPFGFFQFTPVGAVMLLGGEVLLGLLGHRLLPAHGPTRSARDSEPTRLEGARTVEEYDLGYSTHLFRAPEDSPALGRSLAELALPQRLGASVLRLHLPGGGLVEEEPGPGSVLRPGAQVVLQATPEAAARAAAELGLQPMPGEALARLGAGSEPEVAELVLTPRSPLIGQTVKESRFRDLFGVQVVGVRRLGEPLPPPVADLRLRFGDTLLVRGRPGRVRALRTHARHFVVVGELEPVGARRADRRAWRALTVTGGMVVLLVTGVMPPALAVLCAALAMVLTRCVRLPEAYRSVSWESLVLIAGMLPLATALDRTGAMALAVQGLVGSVGSLGPWWTLAALLLATSTLSLVVSNTATSVLVAPIALTTALELGVDPHAFLMAVAIGASTAFSTPMASPTNTLVLAPGGYRFRDYLRCGLPMQALVFVLSLLVLPLFFPFR